MFMEPSKVLKILKKKLLQYMAVEDQGKRYSEHLINCTLKQSSM